MLSETAQTSLQKVLDIFQSGQIPAVIAHTMIPSYDKPCNRWSLTNQIITLINQTSDARGFRQWQQVNRLVKKGSKAFYIIAPMTAKDKADPDKVKVFGFRGQPVFRYEDTEGDPLPEVQVEPAQAPPLMDRAREWGIEVHYRPGIPGAYGVFNLRTGNITLATHDEDVFFHELAHAADSRIYTLKGGQDPWQEIVAELSAAALMHYHGLAPVDGRAYQYIAHYAEKEKIDPLTACFKVLARVQKVLGLLLGQDKREVNEEEKILT
jgi:hypothetical protein